MDWLLRAALAQVGRGNLRVTSARGVTYAFGDGSGTTIADVNRLLKGFEQMQGMFKSLGGKGTKGIRGKTRLLRQLKNIDPSQLGQAGL